MGNTNATNIREYYNSRNIEELVTKFGLNIYIVVSNKLKNKLK